MTEKKVSKNVQEKIAQLQMIQQRMQVLASQKQAFQLQLVEVENALGEVSKSTKPVYKMIGGVLIEKKVAEVKKELEDKKKMLDLRIKNFEKQEESTKKQALDLQKEVTSELK